MSDADRSDRRDQPDPLANPRSPAVRDIAAALTALLADLFVLYLKTKSFQWHASGPHSGEHGLLLAGHAAQILEATDAVAGRVRKLGASTLRSVGHVARLQRLCDNDADYLSPLEMLIELRDDNRQLVERLRDAHRLCADYGDVASCGTIATWTDQAEGRAWFLAEAARGGNSGEPGTLE